MGRPSKPVTEKKPKELSAEAFLVITEYRQNMAYLIISSVVDTLICSSLFVQGNWFPVINFMFQMRIFPFLIFTEHFNSMCRLATVFSGFRIDLSGYKEGKKPPQ